MGWNARALVRENPQQLCRPCSKAKCCKVIGRNSILVDLSTGRLVTPSPPAARCSAGEM